MRISDWSSDVCFSDLDGDAAAEFERDHQWQQRARHAHRFHVLLCAGIAADLAPASNDEQCGDENAADEVAIRFDAVENLVHLQFSTMKDQRIYAASRTIPAEDASKAVRFGTSLTFRPSA